MTNDCAFDKISITEYKHLTILFKKSTKAKCLSCSSRNRTLNGHKTDSTPTWNFAKLGHFSLSVYQDNHKSMKNTCKTKLN